MPATPVRVRFRAFTRNNVRIRTNAILAKAIELEVKYANLLIEELRSYPAPLPNQRYQRTFELGRHWKVQPGDPKILPSGIICRVINDVQDTRGKYYATYVQGPWQTSIHAGRWTKTSDDPVVTELRRGFARELQASVRANIGYV